VIEYREWTVLPERQISNPIDVPPRYKLEFTVRHLLAASSARDMKETYIELQGMAPNAQELRVFESSSKIKLPFIVPCELQNLTIAQTVDGGVSVSLDLCQPIPAGGAVEFTFPCWRDCNYAICDASDGMECFRVLKGSVLKVQVTPSPDSWVVDSPSGISGNYSLNSVIITSQKAVLPTASLRFRFSGLDIPLLPGLSTSLVNISVRIFASELWYSAGLMSALDLIPRRSISESFFTSFLAGMDTINEDGALGFAFVPGVNLVAKSDQLCVVFGSSLRVFQANIFDFKINGSFLPVSFKSFPNSGASSNVTIVLPSALVPGSFIQFKMSGFKNPPSAGPF